MTIKETIFEDALIIEPKIFKDKRGYFYENFNHRKFNEFVGHFDIKQINQSKSKHGVLRGLHFQRPPYTQAKLVNVIKGMVIDVIVDIRTDSPTFGQHQSFVLDDVNKLQLFVPRGFAHGFIVLSPNAIFQYAVDNYYSKEHDDGIRFDDTRFNIDWEIQKPKLSDNDKKWTNFDWRKFHTKAEYQQNSSTL